MRSRTKMFIINTVTSALQQIVLFAAGLIIPNILLRYYGSVTNGLVTSITQLISYISLIEAGLSASIVFYLYKPLSIDDRDAISGIVSAAKVTYAKLGRIFLYLSLLVSVGYCLLAKVKSLSMLEIFLLVMTIGTSGSLEFFTMARYRVLLTADQRIYVLATATMVGSAFNILVTVMCASAGANVVIMKIAAMGTVLVRSLILSTYLHRKYKLINYNAHPDYKSLDKRWDALYMQILWSLQAGAPIVIVTVYTDMVQVSIYSIYNLVMYGINNLVSIFLSGIQSTFGEILVIGDKKLLRKVYGQFLFAFYSAITVVYAITMVMIMPFIRLYTMGLLDSVMYYDSLLGMLFIINGFFYSIKIPQVMMISAAGMYKETKMQTTIQGIILVVGGIMLTGVFGLGLYGVLIAMVISNVYRVVDVVVYTSKHIIDGSVLRTVKYIFTCVVQIILTLVVSHFVKPHENGYLMWFIDAIKIAGISIIIVIMWSLLLNRSDISEISNRLFGVFKFSKELKT